MQPWEKHTTDLYLLANDILEQQAQQPPSYRLCFYYTFNQELPFMLSDGSLKAQTRLLRELANKGMLMFDEEAIAADLPDDFVSIAVERDKTTKFIYLTIDMIVFSEKFEELRQFKPKAADAPKPLPLPKPIATIGSFTVHEDNYISYNGRLVDLQRQQAKVAALVMERAAHGAYTPITMIIDECLTDKYLASVEDDERAPYEYVNRIISKVQGIFRIVANSPNKKYFPNQRSVSYTFQDN